MIDMTGDAVGARFEYAQPKQPVLRIIQAGQRGSSPGAKNLNEVEPGCKFHSHTKRVSNF